MFNPVGLVDKALNHKRKLQYQIKRRIKIKNKGKHFIGHITSLKKKEIIHPTLAINTFFNNSKLYTRSNVNL